MIPKDWEVMILQDLSKKPISYGIVQTGDPDIGDIPCVRVVDLSASELNPSKMIKTTHVISQSYKKTILEKDEIMFALRGDIGLVKIVNKRLVGCNLTRGIARISPKPNIVNPKYLFWVLQSEKCKKSLLERVNGSALQEMPIGELRKIPIPVPPLLEQCKIAEVLGVWDESIDLLERLIGKCRSRKQGLMQQLLTGKQRFKEFGLPVISEDSIPDTWRKVTLRETAAKEKYSFTGGPFGSNLKAEHYMDEGVRIIQLQNIGDGHFNDKYKIFTTEEKADELISCNIYPGDIILSKMGDPVARACFIPDSAPRFLMASDGIRLKVNKSEFDPFFLLQQINSPIFRKIAVAHSTGSTRQRIGLDILRDLPILTPPLPEQEKIAAVLSAADEEISTLEKQLAAYKQQKLGLMQQLLTGKIRVGTI